VRIKIVEEDSSNINSAVEMLIDAVVVFKGNQIEADDFHTMINVLDYAKHVFSGVTYKYGIPALMEDEDDDEN